MTERITLTRSNSLKGEVSPPPDKSISHRALIFCSLAKGSSRIKNLLRAADPISTMNAMRALGVEIIDRADEIVIKARGLYELSEPQDIIDCGNSGTTMRLLTGLLSAQPFFSVLTGDSSLRSRPMKRVITPLSEMGASIMARQENSLAPIAIKGGRLRGIHYRCPVASAQVKSAILLAGLYAEGTTTVVEPRKSRDHTERMLPAFGAKISVDDLSVSISSGAELYPVDIVVPGDFSSAAFFMVAALIIKGSEVLIKNVCINPTRTGLINAISSMGGNIQILNEREVSGEPVADILCQYTEGLKGIDLPEELVPSMIDEFPIFTVLATQAEGITTVRGAEELRVKESDRISTMARELSKMGVEVEEFPDGMSIKGPVKLKGAQLNSHHDHRVAMALSVAALVAEGESVIEGTEAVDISFPGFYEVLRRLSV
ncbi:MAG: 3-phosphoshikimate 1-carboxyvinyltransferase [Nitrospirae bacterium]|nr:3-phosphoshikimate 1-carboxyvinyltransferase [Nitrospirota bacterium]